jgi:hypothetical protein
MRCVVCRLIWATSPFSASHDHRTAFIAPIAHAMGTRRIELLEVIAPFAANLVALGAIPWAELIDGDGQETTSAAQAFLLPLHEGQCLVTATTHGCLIVDRCQKINEIERNRPWGL